MIFFIFFKILILCFNFTYSEESNGNKTEIKYELAITTPSYSYEKSNHTKEVVTSQEHAFSITILNDVPVLRKGMLNIAPETYYFWMDNRSLEILEPGVFDNQNITVEIRLEYNKLTVISTGTFKNLKIQKLDLSYNKITHLEENAISDLPELTEVHLGRNEIVKFNTNSFMNTPKLSSFDIVFNKLQKLDEKSFNFMKKEDVVGVGVSNNELIEIDPKAFEGIKIFTLGLDHNKLKNIPDEVFSKNELRFLELNNNQLESLPEAFFKQKNVTVVNIQENQLNCEIQKKLKAFSDTARVSINFDNKNC